MPLSTRPIIIFRHIQTTPSSSWTITHGQGSYPIVDVFVTVAGVEQKVLPQSVSYVDANSLQLGFSIPRSGYATVVV